MPSSRVRKKTLTQRLFHLGAEPLNFDDEQWVISLINASETSGEAMRSGHAKIIVEGYRDDALYVAFFHIMTTAEEEMREGLVGAPEGSWPDCLRNHLCQYIVAYRELDEYNDKMLEQCEHSTALSWERTRDDAERMIANIKQEATSGEFGDYEYLGPYSIFGRGEGHNCLTWANEKLAEANINNAGALDHIAPKPKWSIGGCSIQ